MRTTVNLADDVAAEVARICKQRGVGLSAAINELARAGMTATTPVETFQQRSVSMGLRIDVSNVGDVLDMLDDDDH
ncbi:MAG: CopG family transcriptional regulator [Actinobacteria bacterium]|nr:CopG family transcriptional regulator [Micrococcales bacterium]MCB0904427.1 CopG family transcriptional regulator [Actinomycetota bacterium]HRV66648.1 hypothetical protein [Candidatus Nanopelagicales bacterium]MCB9429900.1 CopG family transcriptional regulator [Actinomycetota bacterium]HPE12671.1 CopG family transcriptional regulator [Actinomycetota bacterium]